MAVIYVIIPDLRWILDAILTFRMVFSTHTLYTCASWTGETSGAKLPLPVVSPPSSATSQPRPVTLVLMTIDRLEVFLSSGQRQGPRRYKAPTKAQRVMV